MRKGNDISPSPPTPVLCSVQQRTSFLLEGLIQPDARRFVPLLLVNLEELGTEGGGIKPTAAVSGPLLAEILTQK